MKFFSTRDHFRIVTASQAIAQGLSDEGGLFVPESFPQVDVEALCQLDYPELAAAVVRDDQPEVLPVQGLHQRDQNAIRLIRRDQNCDLHFFPPLWSVCAASSCVEAQQQKPAQKTLFLQRPQKHIPIHRGSRAQSWPPGIRNRLTSSTTALSSRKNTPKNSLTRGCLFFFSIRVPPYIISIYYISGPGHCQGRRRGNGIFPPENAALVDVRGRVWYDTLI